MELFINDRIINRKIEFFDKFNIEMDYDAIASVFKLEFFFNPDNPAHKEITVPGHYHLCTISHNKQLILTGQILNETFNDYPEPQLMAIGGYSLPGVIEDCEIYPSPAPATLRNLSSTPDSPILSGGYPLQSDGLSLEEIARKYLAPFRIKMVIDPSVSADMKLTYDETTAKETQSLKSYLCDLASERNIVITHDQYGRLVFTRPSVTKKPIFHFERGTTASIGMSLTFNGKAMHSHIKSFQQQDINSDVPATENEIENPFVPFVFRPHVIVQSSGEANSTLNVAKNVRANELRNLKLKIDIPRWEVGHSVIRPGEVISVTNPYIYLYKKSDWFVEHVSLDGDAEKMSGTLLCVPKEAYNGAEPKYPFEGINLR
jgi:hypothetical protein